MQFLDIQIPDYFVDLIARKSLFSLIIYPHRNSHLYYNSPQFILHLILGLYYQEHVCNVYSLLKGIELGGGSQKHDFSSFTMQSSQPFCIYLYILYLSSSASIVRYVVTQSCFMPYVYLLHMVKSVRFVPRLSVLGKVL